MSTDISANLKIVAGAGGVSILARCCSSVVEHLGSQLKARDGIFTGTTALSYLEISGTIHQLQTLADYVQGCAGCTRHRGVKTVFINAVPGMLLVLVSIPDCSCRYIFSDHLRRQYFIPKVRLLTPSKPLE